MKKAQREALRRNRDMVNRICRENNVRVSSAAAKLLTSPFQKCGQGKREICAASPPVPVIETRIVEPAPRRRRGMNAIDLIRAVIEWNPFR
jgi:hypothetical protein